MNKYWQMGMGFLIIFAIACAGCGKEEKNEAGRPPTKPPTTAGLMVAGSGSNIELTRHLAAEYARQSGKMVEVPGSIGTTGAIRAVRDGAIPLGLASRPLTSAETATGLKQIPYAVIGLVVAVHPTVPDTDITPSTLIKIYAGERKTWGDGAAIVALCMYEGDSTNDVLRKEIPAFADALQTALSRQDWRIVFSEGAMLETLTKTPHSIGFIDAVAAAKHATNVKILSWNGAGINGETLRTGRYPLKKMLFFIYKDELSTEARHFVEFCLSGAGRRIISASDAIPARRGE